MKSIAIDHFHASADRRLRVEWKFCKRCNFDCSYCSKYTHDNNSPWRDLSDYKKAVDKILKCTNKEIWLSFTGGEPCIYPQFKELIKYCKNSGIHFLSVCSNGSKSPDYYVEIMKYLNNIIISCHFEYKVNVLESILAVKEYIKNLNKTIHIHVMMLPGHFDQAIKVMTILKKNGVMFGVRRIRPLYMPDGVPTKPYQKGGDLKMTSSGPDYSNDKGYYSNKELEFFKGDLHEYI